MKRSHGRANTGVDHEAGAHRLPGAADGEVRALHLLCYDGITAELWLGALIDAGASPARMQEAIDRTGLPVRLVSEPRESRAVLATSVHFVVDDAAPRVERASELMAHIASADLEPRANVRARAIGEALMLAEAAVHGTTLEEVRLEELGRAHTVGRIIGSAVALEDLGVDRVTTSPVSVGGGTVEIGHGCFPVPAPAVLHLLRGFTVFGDEREQELTTPSGAAVLAALAAPSRAIPLLEVAGHGRGAVHDYRSERLLTVLIGDGVG